MSRQHVEFQTLKAHPPSRLSLSSLPPVLSAQATLAIGAAHIQMVCSEVTVHYNMTLFYFSNDKNKNVLSKRENCS